MKIKRFVAPTMAEALRQVKDALGDDAVLLDTATAAGTVTLTAAVDDGAERSLALGGDLLGGERELVGSERELVDEVRALVATVRTLLGEAPAAADPLPLARLLVEHGVDPAIAAALAAATRGLDAGAEPLSALADALAQLPAPRPARVRLLVGPPGDGKTTTIAKLAARERSAGRQVLLVAADTFRLGGQAEISAYGRVLEVAVARASEPGDLARLVAGAAGMDRILVDTPGAGPGQNDELAELGRLAVEAGPESAVTLVTSAATAPGSVARTCEAYAALTPDACVLTKLDAASPAPLIALLWQRRLGVSHLTTGRSISGDLEPATPERLARCLLAA